MVVFGNGFDGVAVGVSVAKDLEVKHVVDVVLEVVERLCGDFRFIGDFGPFFVELFHRDAIGSSGGDGVSNPDRFRNFIHGVRIWVQR